MRCGLIDGEQAPQTGRGRQRAESQPEETDPYFRRGIIRDDLLKKTCPFGAGVLRESFFTLGILFVLLSYRVPSCF